MKALLLALIAIFSVHFMNAQNSEPTAWTFNLDGTQTTFNLNNYQQTHILTGFQWSSTLGMNNILMNNAFAMHHYAEVPQNSRPFPLMLINQPTYMDRTDYHVAFNSEII